MKIHVLSFSSPDRISKTTRTNLELLTNAAAARGHELVPIFAQECVLKFNGKPKMLLHGKPLKGIKALIVRANFLGKDLDFHSTFIKQFELTGTNVINGYEAVVCAKNKVKHMQILKQAGIPMPKTYVVRSAQYIDEIIPEIGHFPVIVKAFSSSHGLGVAIAESKRALRSLIELVMESETVPPLTIQEYVREAKGKDLRVFVVGGKVIAAMTRETKKKGEFRSNFSLGGKVKVTELTAKEKRIAIKAASACGLEVAGVDILRTNDGPEVIEINANPGLEGITNGTGVDVAGKIIDYAVKKYEQTLPAKKKKKTTKK